MFDLDEGLDEERRTARLALLALFDLCGSKRHQDYLDAVCRPRPLAFQSSASRAQADSGTAALDTVADQSTDGETDQIAQTNNVRGAEPPSNGLASTDHTAHARANGATDLS
jgi:hypothetical protein